MFTQGINHAKEEMMQYIMGTSVQQVTYTTVISALKLLWKSLLSNRINAREMMIVWKLFWSAKVSILKCKKMKTRFHVRIVISNA